MPLPPIGVQSWCFREFKTPAALIEQIHHLGVSHLELCAVHANFDDPKTFDQTIATYKSAKLQITSIGVQTFRNNPAKEEPWFQFTKAAGAKMIATMFDLSTTPDCYATAIKLAEKYDLLLGIHNHGGYSWLGNADMLSHVFAHHPPRLGLCMDTAWCLQAGEDPLKWIERFRDRLFSVHIKDFTFDKTGKYTDVVIGAGALKLRELTTALKSCPNLTSLTLEYEADASNPTPKLKECLRAFQAAL